MGKRTRLRQRLLLTVASAIPLLGWGFSGRIWHEGPPLLQGRYFHAAAATSTGLVFVYGGWIEEAPHYVRTSAVSEKGLLILDPSMHEWRYGSNPPPHHHRGVVHFYRSYVEVGRKPIKVPDQESVVSEDSLPNEAPFAGSDGRDRVYWFSPIGPVYFDAGTLTWGQPDGPVLHNITADWTKRVDRENSMSGWLRHSGATATGPDGRLYLTGGRGRGFDDPDQKEQVLDVLEIYDPTTDSWTTGAPMQHPRQFHSSAFGADGRLYVFGGCAGKGGGVEISSKPEVQAISALELSQQARSVREVEVYDPATNHWEERAPMPTPRQLLSATAGLDGLIYVIGGERAYGHVAEDMVETYNPATDTWADGPSLRRPLEGHASTRTPDGRIWVTGGVSPGPGLFEPVRLLRGDHEGAQESVEILETAPVAK